MPCSIQYHFVQQFPISAQEAYTWCTDFDQADHSLMGDENARRQITRITDNTLILTDVFHIAGERIEKQKLVQLYSDKYRWTSTHLTGPIKYSQFIYEISSISKNASCLDFTGLFIDYGREKLDSISREKIAKQLIEEDSCVWKLLAEAMEQDLSK